MLRRGRGALKRVFDRHTADGWATRDIEYDVMGRVYRTSNPYFSPGYVTGPINPDGFWTTSTFDLLGRTTQITMPQGDNNNSLTTSVQYQYDGVFTTVIDQAGKTRRQKTDALGRLVRLDEPDLSGNLGTTGSPTQATTYEYNVLSDLIHIANGTQHRYFKYDSLSRLIRERLVEQVPNPAFDLSDPLTNNSAWTRRIEYNSDGLVTDEWDARGVRKQFFYDGLNRITDVTYSDSTPPVKYYYDSQALPSGAPSYDHGPANGRLIAKTYGGATAITGNYYGYDNAGRVVIQKQVTGSNVYSLGYSYNLAGLLTNETYPSGRSVWVPGGTDGKEGIWSLLSFLNNDKSWTNHRALGAFYRDMVFLPDGKLVACGAVRNPEDPTKYTDRRSAIIALSDDEGRNWSVAYGNDKARSLNAIYALDANHIWAVGDGGLVVRFVP